MKFLLIYLALLAFQLAALEWGPTSVRWAEGWLVPHATPRERCRIKCGTCVRP